MRPGEIDCPDVTIPIEPSVRSCPSHRSARLLISCIAALRIATNRRYVPRDTSGDGRIDTHCDAAVCDLATAMGCYLPFEWRGRELSANGTIEWLRTVGRGYKWTEVDRGRARVAANDGRMVIAARYNPAGRGHLAVVRPSGDFGELMIAQAGASRFEAGPLSKGFGADTSSVVFFVHP